ncbi:CRISPR-associated endonuclease Cas1 [compost metagenome]
MKSALEAVGLDAYVGFLLRDRPGRASLALDVMELEYELLHFRCRTLYGVRGLKFYR